MDASFRILLSKCNKIQSYNHPSKYFGLTGRDAYALVTPELWIPIQPGLAGHNGLVSFRSCHNARKYLRHTGFLLYNDDFENIHNYLSWKLHLVNVKGSTQEQLHMKV